MFTFLHAENVSAEITRSGFARAGGRAVEFQRWRNSRGCIAHCGTESGILLSLLLAIDSFTLLPRNFAGQQLRHRWLWIVGDSNAIGKQSGVCHHRHTKDTMEPLERQWNPAERQFERERVNRTIQRFLLATSRFHLDSVSVHFCSVLESVGHAERVHVLATNDQSLGNHSVEENLLEMIVMRRGRFQWLRIAMCFRIWSCPTAAGVMVSFQPPYPSASDYLRLLL